MKNFSQLISLFFVLQCSIITAQSPQKFTYQAVVRNNDNTLAKNQVVGVKISIVQGSENGTIAFQEIYNPNPSTNANGLLTLPIGGGIAITGTFAAIDWKQGPYFVRSEVDPNGGTNYTLNVTSQLLTVPYALLAKDVENVPSLKLNQLSDVNSQSASAGQVLKWNGTEWVASNDNTGGGSGPTYTAGNGISINGSNVISNSGDLSATNELQQLTLSGTVLTLSQNGGSVTLPSSGGGSGDNWGTQTVVTDNQTITGAGTSSNPLVLGGQSANNGQTLKWNGSKWAPANDNDTDNQSLSLNGANLSLTNGGSVTLPDASATNEIQSLSLSGSSVILSNGGGTVVLPDPSATNEIQTLSVSGNNLSLSNGGGTVAIPSSPWIVNGSNIYYTNGAVGIGVQPPAGAPFNLYTFKLSTSELNSDSGMKYGGQNYIKTFNSNTTEIYGNIIPSSSSYYDLGSAARSYNRLYLGDRVYFGNGAQLIDGQSGILNLQGNFDPSINDGSELGRINRWSRLNVKNIDLKDGIYWENAGPSLIDDDAKTIKVRHNLLPDLSHISTLGKAGIPWDLLYVLVNPVVSSDKNLKNNIQDLEYGLDEIKLLKPVKYKVNRLPELGYQLGLIAQDVKHVIPDIVRGDEATKTLGISYNDLLPVLINAIQEQQSMIDDLKSKNNKLSSDNEAIKTYVEKELASIKELIESKGSAVVKSNSDK